MTWQIQNILLGTCRAVSINLKRRHFYKSAPLIPEGKRVVKSPLENVPGAVSPGEQATNWRFWKWKQNVVTFLASTSRKPSEREGPKINTSIKSGETECRCGWEFHRIVGVVYAAEFMARLSLIWRRPSVGGSYLAHTSPIPQPSRYVPVSLFSERRGGIR